MNEKHEIPAEMLDAATKIPVHQWTNESGEVLILRFVSTDGKAFGGFPHPSEVGEKLTVPEKWDPAWGPEPDGWKAGWHATASCGGGIHGWPWGLGLGDGKDPEWDGTWQVYGASPQDVVGEIDGGLKCKFREGTLRHKGDWYSAFMFILDGQRKWVEHLADGASSATGDQSASSATGDRSASAATGYSSASAATGDRSASAATGDRSASAATGYRSASSATGDSSASVVTGLNGKVRAGKFGCLALAWWNKTENRLEMRCAEIGVGDGSDGKLKADTWYSLDNKGQFQEAMEAINE